MKEITLASGHTQEGHAYQIVSRRKYRLAISSHIYLLIHSRFDRQLTIYCKRFLKEQEAQDTASKFTVADWLTQLRKELIQLALK